MNITILFISWFIFYGCVSTAPFVHGALCVLFLSLFRLFVYKPVTLTMPVCVLSCAYCCHGVSVPLLTSTRCKVETIAADRVPCICTGLTLWPFPVAFNTPPPPLSPLTFNLCSKHQSGPVVSGQGRVLLPAPFDRSLWKPAAFFLVILWRRVIPPCRTNK